MKYTLRIGRVGLARLGETADITATDLAEAKRKALRLVQADLNDLLIVIYDEHGALIASKRLNNKRWSD